jgi:hypothetical protein
MGPAWPVVISAETVNHSYVYTGSLVIPANGLRPRSVSGPGIGFSRSISVATAVASDVPPTSPAMRSWRMSRA